MNEIRSLKCTNREIFSNCERSTTARIFFVISAENVPLEVLPIYAEEKIRLEIAVELLAAVKLRIEVAVELLAALNFG